MIKYAQIIVTFFTSAFLLNFFWESLHAVYLYQGHNFPVKKYVDMISYVSFVDALLLIGIFIVGMFMWKSFYWFQIMDRKKYWYIILATMVVAIVIEVKGVHVLNQWAYNELMPILFGIGVSPLIQLTLTGLLSFWFISRIEPKK